jgi:hypothetical protein
MITLYYKIIAISFALFPLFCFSQETNQHTFLIQQYFQHFSSQQQQPKIETSTNNQQVYFNSEVAILQIGDLNSTNINYNAGKKIIKQVGDNNNFEFKTYDVYTPFNFEVLQLGLHNNLQIHGQNSIVNNIKILQFSTNKTITITNYK